MSVDEESLVSDDSMTATLLQTLTDDQSRKILTACTERAKSVEEICIEQGIPISTCYRKVRNLVRKGIMVVERKVVTDDGKKYTLYRASFTRATVDLKDGKVSAVVTLNPDVVQKLPGRRIPEWRDGFWIATE